MNMNVSLTDELANFVKAKVAAGRYTSSSEVVREALRLMEKVEQQEAEKLSFLRKAWQEGIDSGDAGVVAIELSNVFAIGKHMEDGTGRKQT